MSSPKPSCCSHRSFPVISFLCMIPQLGLMLLMNLTFFFFLVSSFRSLNFSGRQTVQLFFYRGSFYHYQQHFFLFPSVFRTYRLMNSVTESPWNKLTLHYNFQGKKITGFKNHNSLYIVVINTSLLSPLLLFSGCHFLSHVVIALLQTPTVNNSSKDKFSESLGSWGLLIAIWLKRLRLLRPIYNTRNFSLKAWTFKNPSQLPWAHSSISGWSRAGWVSTNTQSRIFIFLNERVN